MFNLVLDIEKYPEFLPWCMSCEIIQENEGEIYANLIIGYKVIREWIKCRVTYQRPHSIRVEYINGPLKYLSNTWDFMESTNEGCVVDFYVDFELKNPLFQKLMGVFFNEVVSRMVKAFEDRAESLYGDESKKEETVNLVGLDEKNHSSGKAKSKSATKTKPGASSLKKKET